ncbi:MAG TPA: XRE family transcriptional regulator [Chloroflexi bacterium]|nr:XRE family transcriptional regulator [Chloroflexota bacterium]
MGGKITLYEYKEAFGLSEGKERRYHWNSQSIRALRDYMGLTQQQMADELGTRQQTISEWETGMYQPRGGMNRLLTLVAERAGFDYEIGEDIHQDD